MLPFIQKLVAYLELRLKEVKPHVSQPRFLNDAVMGMPSATLEAVRNETKHLFDNAFDVISHALNIPPKALRSEQDVKMLIKHPLRFEKIDMDEAYNRRVKSLYSEIVAFISRLPASNDYDASREELYRLRLASRDIAEAVKDIKHLQKNMVHYLASKNLRIREQYHVLRLNLATVLQKISHIALDVEDREIQLLALDNVIADLHQLDTLMNGTLDKLIREGAITPSMASSLMNDSTYVTNIANNLISMARVIYKPTEPQLEELSLNIALDREEIQSIVSDEAEVSSKQDTLRRGDKL